MADNPSFVLGVDGDGRQSPAALDIRRGVVRVLAAHRLATVTELPLANGLRADAVGLSPAGDVWIVEIKSGIADFRADAKWPGYLDFCDALYFAVAPGFPVDVLPDEAGLMLADKYGGEIARPAPVSRLAPSRRRALTLRFARFAAARLLHGHDPDFAQEPALVP